MNVFDWEELVKHPRLANMSETFYKAFLDRVMTTNPTKAASSKSTTPEVAPTIEATNSVPMMLRSPRPKPSTAEKKKKKLQLDLMRQSPR